LRPFSVGRRSILKGAVPIQIIGIQLLIFALLMIGSAFLFGLHPLLWIPTKEEWKAKVDRLVKRLQKGRKQSLLRKVRQSQGKGRSNFFLHNLSDARRILTSTNQQGKVKLKLMMRMSAVCFCGGLVAAVVMQNILMLPVLSVGCSLIPMWYIRYSEVRYKRQLCDELEVALSVITSSYLRTDNLSQSVEENLSYLEDPVRAAFQKFVNGVKFVDANVQNNIQNLKASLQNPVFHDWCDILTLCMIDRNYKYSLSPVVEQFSDNRALQNSLETILQQPVKTFNIIVGISVGMIPLLFVINKSWFITLVSTWGGKAILAAMSVAVFAGMNKAIGLTAPID